MLDRRTWIGSPILRFLTLMVFLGPLLAGCGRNADPNQPPAGALAGTVLLAAPTDGNHSGVTVYIPGSSYQARTARDGAYMITGLAPGKYEVMAEHPRAVAQSPGTADIVGGKHTVTQPARLPTIMLEAADDAATTATATAGGFGSIRGFVFLEGVESSDGVRIRIENTRFVTVAEPDGSYRFPVVEPGDFTVSYSRSGYEPVKESVRVEASLETVIGEVALLRDGNAQPAVPPTAITTTLSPSLTTEPVQRASLVGSKSILGVIEIIGADGAKQLDFSEVVVAIENTDYIEIPDARGIVRFAQLPAGVYRIIASMSGGEPQSALADLTLDNTARVSFKFDGQASAAPGAGTIAVVGQVVSVDEAGTETPLIGASVAIANSQIVGVTGDNGQFRLESVPENSSTLLVTKDRYDDLATAVESGGRPSAEIDLGRLILRPRVNAPRVVATTPANGAANVSVGLTLPVLVRFSRAMDQDSVFSSVRLFPDSDFKLFMGGGRHPLSDDSTLVIELQNSDDRRPIRFGTAYQVEITRAAKDREGTALAEDYAFNFRTGGFGVVSTYPVDGERDTLSGPASEIRIQFNTRLRPESVRENNIQVRPRLDSVPQLTLTEDPNTGWTTIRMLTRLQDNRTYTVVVGPGIRAANGQRLSNTPYQFSFRTARQVRTR